MRVMHLICTDVFSGAENVACQIINGFKNNNNYEMVYCSPAGSNLKSLKERNINYYQIQKFNYFSVKKAVNDFKPDIIHAHDIKASVMATIVANKNVKVVSQVHGNHENMRYFNLKTYLFNICSKKFQKIIWVSQSAYDNYEFKNKIKNKSQVLYNMIDTTEITKKIKNDSNCYEAYDLIFLGRLTYPKNPERLIKIINEVKKVKDNVKVAIVGTGDLEEKVSELIRNYDLESNIKMFGYISNPYKILDSSKLLILTSIYEGTPMVALEAIALGKPIISTPTDGMIELIINGKTGYLSDDDQVLKEKIIELLDDKKKYINMKKNIEERNQEVNNIKKYLEMIESIYRQ